MRKRLLLTIIMMLLLVLTSCEEIEGILSILPKFDGNLPNNISGEYAYYASEADKKNHIYTRLYVFNSKDNTFSEYTETTERSGTYTVKYKAYAVTECNGILTFDYENGTSESYSFYFYATAVNGPEYIIFGDRTYYYNPE